MKRNTKWYRKNEAEVMNDLGLVPTKNSGSGWIEKGDGQNENVICELKSTDADSYRLNLLDLQKIQHHANVSHKVPVFAVQFIKAEEVYLIVKPEDLQDLAKGLAEGFKDRQTDTFLDIDDVPDIKQKHIHKIKSSKSARERFHTERESRYNKERKAYK